MFNKRIGIFTGHFGSGKTEVAVNYALKLAEKGCKTAIVDFDIVNPYFRTADARERLESRGIYVLAPMYANTNVDVPALPAEISAIFEKKEYRVVFDVGGDDLGARVLSRYRNEIGEDDYEMFFVINIKRPMTDTVRKICDMAEEIQYSSRLKITSLVNNTNLLGKTTFEHIEEGHRMISEVSEKMNIPIGFTSLIGKSGEELEIRAGAEILRMEKLIKLPWD
ncbi:hypothetical protein DFR58_11317 [Anaerobacterium chartisolvens]|uniref:CobQ/CobB/MinD/ParA family nucleotide binding protein n=1 Tax=Anaerobacterium chartisolvens TaxID=1297424 RepID=A0A369B4F6_9FIRM|nr:hypothetical protein [Anaerobacterium chartisolvens]RCX15437.1 hypothetical protein DFR58_11317 [Anaerobacterium chartisolvens]